MDPKNVPDLPHLRNKANINDDYDHQIGLLSEVELRQLSKDLHSLFAAVASSSEGDRIGQA